MKTLPKIINLKITDEDISSGKRGNAAYCPIARALKRRKIGRIHVSGYRTYIGSGQPKAEYTHGDSARSFICDFDKGGPSAVKPMTVVLVRGLA